MSDTTSSKCVFLNTNMVTCSILFLFRWWQLFKINLLICFINVLMELRSYLTKYSFLNSEICLIMNKTCQETWHIFCYLKNAWNDYILIGRKVMSSLYFTQTHTVTLNHKFRETLKWSHLFFSIAVDLLWRVCILFTVTIIAVKTPA